MNLAITSGYLAAETVCEALGMGDFSSKQLSRYETRLNESFVLRDMKTFGKTVDLMHNDHLFSVYPALIGTILEQLYRSDGKPRKKMGRLGWDAVREALPVKDLICRRSERREVPDMIVDDLFDPGELQGSSRCPHQS